MPELITTDERVSPTRGLILLENDHGKPIPSIDLRRWIHLCKVLYKSEKVDLFAGHSPLPDFEPLFEQAEKYSVALSLRTRCVAGPPYLKKLKARGLFDVFLTPARSGDAILDAWLTAAREAGLPIRVQLIAPFAQSIDVESVAKRYADCGVTSVNLGLYDPFTVREPGHDAPDASIAKMLAFADALGRRNIEVNLLRVPFCQVPERYWTNVRTERQFHYDHQQYDAGSFDLAFRLYKKSPVAANIVLLILLRRQTIRGNIVDDIVLPWVLEHPWFYVRLQLWRRITRHLSFIRSVPRPMNGVAKSVEASIGSVRKRDVRARGPICSECSLQFICDGHTPALRRVEPELRLRAVPGEHVVSVTHFAAEAPRYFDPIDSRRLGFRDAQLELAKAAMDIVTNTPPDRVIVAKDFGLEKSHYDVMQEGSFRWYSFSNSEKVSKPLGRFEPPFTVALTVASGIAEYIGFELGRHCKLMCPMEAYRHDLALHVNADGYYVLLRDGKPIKPIEFQGEHFVPQRLAGVLEPRIALTNIDCYVVTQSIKTWEHKKEDAAFRPKPKYSIMMVCTRYARRLQIALRSFANQKNFDLSQLEVVIAYVPGIDITDDVIDTMKVMHPELRIVRSPFPDRYANAKGFMINETVKILSGEWVFLVDADTIIPPDFFERVEKVAADAHFIAPDGRKMLTHEDTARVLMGDVKPWDMWDELVSGAGEFRFREGRGVPIGYCQGARTQHLKDIKYEEHEHFETADWYFGVQMIEKFGPVTRLSGCPVIHLDHGGSQWYGTAKQF
jgi:hypothetical protein